MSINTAEAWTDFANSADIQWSTVRTVRRLQPIGWSCCKTGNSTPNYLDVDGTINVDGIDARHG
jgi:hypothetical protein